MRRKRTAPRRGTVAIVISDVDGVWTDGSVYIGTNGTEAKRFHLMDGAGVVLLRAVGIPVALISGRFSAATLTRARELGLENDCYQGMLNKVGAYEELKKKYSFTDAEAAFIGDDLIDVPLLGRVGYPIAVANAHPGVKKLAHFTTRCRGGEGAFREAAEFLLRRNGSYEEAVKKLKERIDRST